jgi:hypothetical protein
VNTLTVAFIGLVMYLSDPSGRTAVVIDVSHGMTLRGHHVQDHAAKLKVRVDDVIGDPDWPGTPKDGFWYFDLDGRSLSLAGINLQQPLKVDSTFCNVPRIREECPPLVEDGAHKSDAAMIAEAAATLRIEHGALSAFCNRGGAVATRWVVETTRNVTITGSKNKLPAWTVTIQPQAKIEIRNEPIGDEDVQNHFIAYYGKIAAPGVAVCTNIPFARRSKTATCETCPVDDSLVSTVACSNSTFP